MPLEKVREAENVLHELAKAAPEASHFAPQPMMSAQQRISESSTAALLSLQDLNKDIGSRINSFLGFRSGAIPRETPISIKTPEEARRYCQELYDKHARTDALRTSGLPPPPGWKAPDVFAGPMQNTAFERLAKGNESIRDEAASWLNPSYLGPWVGPAFNANPPVVVTMPGEFMKAYQKANGMSGETFGLYANGTNIVMISEKVTDPIKRLEIILHESFHYAAYLGSGGKVARCQEKDGSLGLYGIGPNNEALTQFHTKELMERNGYHIVTGAYAPEMVSASYIQKLVGAEPLRRAFLTGDYTEVRSNLDTRLGNGTFDALMTLPRGVDQLAFLRSTMITKQIRYSEWDKDPVVRSTRVV